MTTVAEDGELVCPNHPNRRSVSRCVCCFKPLCEACIKVEEELDFCSKACAAKHFATSKTMSAHAEKERRNARKRLVKKLIVWVVLLTLAGAGYWAYSKNIAGFGDFLREWITYGRNMIS